MYEVVCGGWSLWPLLWVRVRGKMIRRCCEVRFTRFTRQYVSRKSQ